jgi:hypothetical protein
MSKNIICKVFVNLDNDSDEILKFKKKINTLYSKKGVKGCFSVKDSEKKE